jgi:hypothetical protein
MICAILVVRLLLNRIVAKLLLLHCLSSLLKSCQMLEQLIKSVLKNQYHYVTYKSPCLHGALRNVGSCNNFIDVKIVC